MTLVVTADDLGLSPGVTKGILESHRRGIVRSSSLIVTADSSAEAAAQARLEPELEVGLHIDLVGGWPVSDPAAVRSLIDDEGRFLGLTQLTRRLFSGRDSCASCSRAVVGDPSARLGLTSSRPSHTAGGTGSGPHRS